MGAVAHPRGQPGAREQVAGQALGAVLAPAEQVEVGRGQRVVQGDDRQVHPHPAATGPLGEHARVAPVAVGAQQLGVEEGEPQHGELSRSQWEKAV